MNIKEFNDLLTVPEITDASKKKAIDSILRNLPTSIGVADWKKVHVVAVAVTHRVEDVEKKMLFETSTAAKGIGWLKGCLDPKYA